MLTVDAQRGLFQLDDPAGVKRRADVLDFNEPFQCSWLLTRLSIARIATPDLTWRGVK